MQNGIILAHRLEILHQRKRIRELDHDILDVHCQHLEPGLVQQPADIPDVRQRGYMWADTTSPLEVRQLQRRAELK